MDIQMKIIIGEDHEKCVEKAEIIFGCAKEELMIEVLKKGSPEIPWQVLAGRKKDREAFLNRNEIYRFNYEPEGVFFERIPSHGSGTSAEKSEITLYAERKALSGLNTEQFLAGMDQGFCNLCVAPAQQEHICDEEVRVAVSRDEMEAFLTLLAPDPGGTVLTLAGTMEEIQKSGVVFGIDEKTVSKVLSSKLYGRQIRFAAGKEPVDGIDGTIQFLFRREHDATPIINAPDGRVDYRSLDLFEKVTAGQKLVTRVPATAGTSGSTVTGRERKPKPGKEARLPTGKNTETDADRLNLFAKTDGMVDYVNQSVVVSNCYRVKGDADLSVGNIDFEGDVVISGNVISGLTIRASGNIEVLGGAEGADLIAGKNVLLRGGMQGMGKGSIEAGADVIAKYVERAEVRAGGQVIADTILHCRVESGGSVRAMGKRGSIIGGTVKAQNEIAARCIGSVSGNRTLVEVGIAPQKRERLKQLQTELQNSKAENEKFDKICKYLSQMVNLPPDKQELQRTVVKKRLQNIKAIGEMTGESEKLIADMEKATDGKIHVTDTVFPGVQISILMGSYPVTDPIKYATFRYLEGEVSFTACQL